MDAEEADSIVSDYKSGKSINWLKSEYNRGYYTIVSVLDEAGIDRRSQKEQCNTESFKQQARERQCGTELSEDHKQAISVGVKESDSNQAYWEGKSQKGVSDKDVLKAYKQAEEDAQKASERLDISARQTLNRLQQMGVDTSGTWNKGKELTEEHKKAISEGRRGITWEDIYGENLEERKQEIGKKISRAKRESDYSHSKKTRKKLRKARISEIEEKRNNGNQIHPSYNPRACKIIEEYGDENGYNFQHAENGGEFYIEELGYWVDGYDHEKNTVIEVDEPRHYEGGKLREKDKERQQEIENYLNCEFIRIKL